ncbi:unnamed protein product, partial [Darwinula stevensoni]
EKFGCTEFVNPEDHAGRPIQEVLAEMTDGGVDFSFECVGNVQAMASLHREANPAFKRAALDCVQKGWGVATIIGGAGKGVELAFPPIQLLFGRKLRGAIFGGYKRDDLPELVEEYLRGELMVDEFVTQELKLEEINKAFDSLRDGIG